MIENAPALVHELDRRKAALAASPGDTTTEMAVWESAAQLGLWHVVNRGTKEDPRPSGFDIDGVGRLIGVYSTRERAGAVAGEDGTVLAVPMPQALDWLGSFVEQGVAGIVLDHPGPWTPLPNLPFFKKWVPQAQTAVGSGPIVLAPQVEAAADAYAADKSDQNYAAVVRQVAADKLFVVLDPQGDGSTPTSIVNGRGERIGLAFTDSSRVETLYAGKAVQVTERTGADLLRMVGEQFDVLILDPQYPSSFAATPEWITKVLDGGEPASKKRSRWSFRGR
ncbi:SseB family protein [Ruania zhangjianzhongii]|uniref:SseB family protein n=1 Tax=Ruania zhangjianzhongii TaxID=2603206 RepID=UPI0011CC820C|nr:SseB family protein [Ruania zhangjianzhongii]